MKLSIDSLHYMSKSFYGVIRILKFSISAALTLRLPKIIPQSPYLPALQQNLSSKKADVAFSNSRFYLIRYKYSEFLQFIANPVKGIR